MSVIATRNAEAGAAHSAEIESIAAGGAGVARLDGRVVFIPRTVPGDSVRFRISADKGKYLRGEIEEIASPGAARRDPPCPHWAECGGCPLLHVNPEGQREAKRRIFLDALIRIGKIDPGLTAEDIEAPSSEFAYRMRVRFQVRGKAIGFFAPGTRRLVPVESPGVLPAPPVFLLPLSQRVACLRGIRDFRYRHGGRDAGLESGLAAFLGRP